MTWSKQRQKVCWDNSFLLRAFRLPWQLNQNAEKNLIESGVAFAHQRFLAMIATRRKFDVFFFFFFFAFLTFVCIIETFKLF